MPHVSLQAVVEIVDDEGLRDVDQLSQHHPDRDRPRVVAHIEIETWHGWGAATRSG